MQWHSLRLCFVLLALGLGLAMTTSTDRQKHMAQCVMELDRAMEGKPVPAEASGAGYDTWLRQAHHILHQHDMPDQDRTETWMKLIRKIPALRQYESLQNELKPYSWERYSDPVSGSATPAGSSAKPAYHQIHLRVWHYIKQILRSLHPRFTRPSADHARTRLQSLEQINPWLRAVPDLQKSPLAPLKTSLPDKVDYASKLHQTLHPPGGLFAALDAPRISPTRPRHR